MRILLTSKAGAGHVGPLIPFARALRAGGAHVLLAAPREARALVTGAGLPYHPLPDPPAERRDPILASVGELPWEQQGVRVMRDVFAGIDEQDAVPATALDAGDGPLVYVTYGSVAPSMPVFPKLFRATVEALADVPARAVFTVAGADRDALGPVPGNVRVESWIPQVAVMPHAAAVLRHGGSGTTRMALAAGVPVVIVPGFADQPRNAARVDELGAGIALPGWPEGLAGLGDAVRRVLGEPSYRHVAERVADEVAALPPVSGAAEVLREWIAPAGAA
jgi:UDP:flavonoid glycosyltransferase YjiC (YdhE family)